MSQRATLWIGLLIVCGLLAAAIARQIEFYEVTVPNRDRGAARADPYLALQRSLQKQGISAQQVVALAPLPAVSDDVPVVWLTSPPPAERLTELANWVHAGGLLVWVDRAEDVDIEAPPWKLPSHSTATIADLPSSTTSTGTLPATRPPAITATGSTPAEATRPEPAAKLWRASWIRGTKHGAGWVGRLGPRLGWTNAHLAESEALVSLGRAMNAPHPKRVLLVTRPDAPPLQRLIWDRFPEAVIALVLLIAAALWRGSLRMGPERRVDHVVRRSLLEHLRASGAMVWQRRAGDALVDRGRGWLSTRLRRRFAGLELPDEEEDATALIRQLHEETGLDPHLLHDALIRLPRGNPATLISIMVAQHRLTQALGARATLRSL